MRILLCCESYFPQRGGVQEVMRQLAERMVARGHDVTVATSWHPKRTSKVINGVKICGFRAGGKIPYGLNGEIDEYRRFVEASDAEAILIMAAQQWTFDALWSVLDRVRARKVFIPCGFSCLYESDFAEYFKQIPAVLRKFDHLIFNASHYRDIDLVRGLGLTNFTIVPNGVSETEFNQPLDPLFRKRIGISDDDFVFLTVGNPIEEKGHPEVIEAFARLNTGGRPSTLICNADWSHANVMTRIVAIARREGVRGVRQLIRRKWPSFKTRLINSLQILSAYNGPSVTQPLDRNLNTNEEMASRASAQPGKRVLLLDLPRSELIQAYKSADLFVFASKIEYSPLVLFEAAAAGTPFLSAPVGNAEEIVRWTRAGIIFDATKDSRGYTCVDPQLLALEMSSCMNDGAMLYRLRTMAQQTCRSFVWSAIVAHYEAILAGKTPDINVEKLGRNN